MLLPACRHRALCNKDLSTAVRLACEAIGSCSSAEDAAVAAVAGAAGEASYPARRSTRTVDCSIGVAGEAPLPGPVAVAAAKLTMGVCNTCDATS